MRFSILLPTRNRLEYLRQAVETVRRQSFADWEVVVSDNDSEDDVAGFVASLGDERMRYVRTEQFIPVTDNWNNALAHASGASPAAGKASSIMRLRIIGRNRRPECRASPVGGYKRRAAWAILGRCPQKPFP